MSVDVVLSARVVVRRERREIFWRDVFLDQQLNSAAAYISNRIAPAAGGASPAFETAAGIQPDLSNLRSLGRLDNKMFDGGLEWYDHFSGWEIRRFYAGAFGSVLRACFGVASGRDGRLAARERAEAYFSRAPGSFDVSALAAVLQQRITQAAQAAQPPQQPEAEEAKPDRKLLDPPKLSVEDSKSAKGVNDVVE